MPKLRVSMENELENCYASVFTDLIQEVIVHCNTTLLNFTDAGNFYL